MADGSRISTALARFDAALRALETAAAGAGNGGRAELGAAEAELRDLRARAAGLAQANRDAGRRIDGAIAKIRTALGG